MYEIRMTKKKLQNFFKQSAIDKCKPEISKFNKWLLVVMG